MTNSERAKFYRVRHRQHALDLTATVTTMREQVRRLTLGKQILHALMRRGVLSVARDRILTHLTPFISAPAQQLAMPGFDIRTVELLHADGYGSDQAPIVKVSSLIHGRHPPASLEAIYHYFPGDSVLLDALMHSVVVYPCVMLFYYSAEGIFATAKVELDWITGLLDCVGGLHEVAKVAGPLRALGEPSVVSSFEFSC